MPPLFIRKRTAEASDGELLRKFGEEGDIAILGHLYERYMHLVYGVCLKYLEDREASKDEVMNIFEKLVTTVPQQKEEIVNFRTWLYVVTKNHCLMLLRSRKSETAHTEAMLADPTFFMENSSEMHPLEEEESDTERLRECIERLKEEQRECIRLFYYEGFGYRQIAEKMGMDENKVKSKIQNGKRNLRICMDKGFIRQ
ncbi:MAG: sigma-70 family RNA polymerase sigma factor [Bacteroidales bacterium]|jgi:RNA polymerase sigma-70 factor (ECF subfamily)|nr:sigma-70 family RNA polymerase sigma factor [Bacteroidales bacterium]